MELEDFDLDDAGELDMPTMRGNANLDVQDYARLPGEPDSTFLDDEIQEDVPSMPGSGAGPASDVDGMSEFDLTDVTEDDPGMSETEYGSYPWRPGSESGYRPASMRTDLSGSDDSPAQEIAIRMSSSPQPTHQIRMEQRNRMPSNGGVDPSTIYDRSSFEYDNDPQNVIGTGIFDMEEGVVWNARDGVFANDYALPAYIAQEGALDVQQSQMWDSTANNWRVVQPSGGGVTFARNVRGLKPTADPFVDQQSLRPEPSGPRSHIEAFGRAAAKAVVDEARTISSNNLRSVFLTQATEALGVGQAAKCRQVAERLISMGYRPDTALEDTLAHCVMHATMKDMADRARGKNGMPRIDKMGSKMRANTAALHQAVVDHVAPIAVDKGKAEADVAALATSPAAKGMGQVATPEPTTPATGRNVLLGLAAVGVGYLFLTKTKPGREVHRNVKRHARRLARKMGVK